ncbi:WD40/YVTN/BNR-like repeat-containing protein [Ilumatobacter sp.]|uniref:WD40/YVTN/BNR-like repeat-containing protein n=1 Tax=Ilumatobacter sp. TaxID=1967498 RepID=UPI003AF53FDC
MTTVDPKLLSQVRYRCIGPSRGGRVVAVAADPVRKNVFYFGAVAGGVWKSDDAGQYWENITDGFLNTASIGALAVAPSDGNVIYAGTGETTIRLDITHGDGMYKSTDAGVTWQHLGLDQTRHIGEIRIHPDDPDLVYVAALGYASHDNPERGVYRSKDGGDTWELVLHVSERAGAVDIAMDPNNPRILFATIWQATRTFWSIDSGGPDSGLWRSKDGGDTWENIGANPGLPDGTLGKMGVSVSPAQSGRVFALVEAEGRTRGLYRSEDHGETWKHLTSKPELQWRPWYYMHVIAHPTDPDTVYVMNMKAWRSIDGGSTFEELHTPHGDNHALWIDPEDPNRMIGCDDGGAWVSLNGGDSWSTIYNQLTAQFYHVATDDQYPYLVYGSQQDNSSIAVPSRTNKGAINWGDCYPPGTAESGYVAPKPGDPNIVYVGAIGSSPGGGDALQRYDHRTRQIQLVSVWPEAYHDGNTAEVRFQWTYPIVFSPHDPDVLYAAGNQVFRSTDEGHSWEAISPDLTYADPATMGVSGPLTMDTAGAEMYATVFSLMVSRHEQGVLMAGSDDGKVHVSRNDGGDWKEVTPEGLPKFSQVTMIEESPHTAGTAYMTVARHKMGDYAAYVYRTTDLGETWTRIDAGIPDDDFCRVIREDPQRKGLLYVGTELGIWASFDDGANWQSLQCNLPVTPVYDFVIKDDDLVVATHGRSFWILDDLTQVRQIADEVHGVDKYLFKPHDTVRTPPDLFGDFWGSPGGKNYHVTIGQNATYYVEEDETGHKAKRVIDGGDDLARGVRITYLLDEDAAGSATLTISDAEGNEIETFSSDIPADKKDRDGRYITAKEGMNVFQWSMNHRSGVKMTGTDFHGRPPGPLAKPGTYQVTLTVGDWSMTQSFDLVKDPRVTTSDDDLAEQFDLMLNIQTKLSQTATAVNTIRSLRTQLEGWAKRLDGDDAAADTIAAANAFGERLTGFENEFVQVEFTSEGDSLNHLEQLFEKLSALAPVVSSADMRPTVQSHQVYEKLAGRIDERLAAFDAEVEASLSAINGELAALGVDIIWAPPE